MSPSLTFVIPTRNRAELAIRAVGALLDHADDELRVLVSDTSSDDEQAGRLARFCRRSHGRRLIYVRAPGMNMAAHWDWALEQALARSDTSHFSIHYDRKVAKPGHMRFLLDAIGRQPEQVLTYLADQVVEDRPRWTLWQTPWTGHAYEIQTARVRQMAADGQISEMGQAWPILSNCAVPRAVLEKIRQGFGNICDSTGPDAAFAFRLCAVEERYTHLDRSLAVMYATSRSNGVGYLTGKATDFKDFTQTWDDRPWLDAVPLPGLNLGWNMLFHEYELVRRIVRGDTFPPLSPDGYLNGLAYGLPLIEDAAERARYQTLLEAHGWQPEPREPAVLQPVLAPRRRRRLPTPRRVLRAVAARSRARQSVVLFLASTFRVMPEHITGFTFGTERRALRFAMKCPRRDVPENPATRLPARRVTART
jgi:hypothetical protein